MEYYYTTSNHQDYPLNYPNNNQPYNDYQNYYYHSSSAFDEPEFNTPKVPHELNYEFAIRNPGYHEYGGYSNQPSIRYDQNYYDNYTPFHSNPYEHYPAQSLTVYQYNSSYDHPLELPAKKGSNFLDPVSTTGFVISYSNIEPKPALEFEDHQCDLRNFHGGYDIEETYGKPLPPSDEICYPPSKFGEGDKSVSKAPETKEEEDDQAEEAEDDDDDEEEEDKEENRGVLIAPPLLMKDDQGVNEAEEDEDEEEEDEDDDEEEEEEEEDRGDLVAPSLLMKDDQGVNEAEEEEEEEEEEESSNSEEEEERENLDGGRVEEKETKRQIVPPGYRLEAMDLCEGVFEGYFPCLRKRSNQSSANQTNSNTNTISSGNDEDYFSGDCWNTTVDYLLGDPDPYVRALPDPIYGYHRYYPEQLISGQFDYGEDHSLMDNSSYYSYGYNGGGY